MVVVSSVARFTAGHLTVLCSPVKGNWATVDPLRMARAKVDSNMRIGDGVYVYVLANLLYYSGQVDQCCQAVAGDVDPAKLPV